MQGINLYRETNDIIPGNTKSKVLPASKRVSSLRKGASTADAFRRCRKRSGRRSRKAIVNREA